MSRTGSRIYAKKLAFNSINIRNTEVLDFQNLAYLRAKPQVQQQNWTGTSIVWTVLNA